MAILARPGNGEEEAGIQYGKLDIQIDDDKTPRAERDLELQADYMSLSNSSLLSRFKETLTTLPGAFLLNPSSFQGQERGHSRSSSSSSSGTRRDGTSSGPSTPLRTSENMRKSRIPPVKRNRQLYEDTGTILNFSSDSAAISAISDATSQATLVDSTSVSSLKDSPKLNSSDVTANAEMSDPPLLSAYSQGSLHIRSVEEENANKSTDGERKKGKRPLPPLPYDVLIADISNDPIAQEEAVDDEEASEWYGLEYTIQISRRDSRASDSSSSTTGEHSKSRESWAAMHRGRIDPCNEDREFMKWQKWHRHLDRIDSRKRRERTVDFKHACERKANYFVDEIYARRALEIYEEDLTDKQVFDAIQSIQHATENYPDPFFPAEKHNLSWVIKNHRSVASLLELYSKDEE